MKHAAVPLLIAALALVLTGCQQPGPRFTFEGTTTVGETEQPLTLTYQQRGDRLTGEYQIRAAKGAFRGLLDGDTITADLTPSPDCTYAFEGVIAGSALTGAFHPTACPGGENGTWTLELQ